MSLADRIIVMNRGRIDQQGTPDEIYMRPRTAFVASFIGRTNWFHGRITAASGDGFSRLVTDAGTGLAIRNSGSIDGKNWSACIRPERITAIRPQDGSAKPGDNLLNGDVVDIVNMGAEFHYIIESLEGRIMVVEPNRAGARVQKGEAVNLLFRAEDCVVLARDED